MSWVCIYFVYCKPENSSYFIAAATVVKDLIAEIRDKLGDADVDDPSGLFLPFNPLTGSKPIWLMRKKTLSFYQITADVIVSFISKLTLLN